MLYPIKNEVGKAFDQAIVSDFPGLMGAKVTFFRQEKDLILLV